VPKSNANPKRRVNSINADLLMQERQERERAKGVHEQQQHEEEARLHAGFAAELAMVDQQIAALEAMEKKRAAEEQTRAGKETN